MQKTATISDCQRYRYRLGRRWDAGKVLVFVMLNPSTADAELDDRTIRRCIGFARSHGFGAIEVVNLYAYRATKPRDLKTAGYPVGPENDRHIAEVCTGGLVGAVCLAWGDNAAGLARTGEVLALLHAIDVQPMALELSQRGIPRHPLMLHSDSRLAPLALNARR